MGTDKYAMANRLEYLGRILRVVVAGDFDGVMGPTDIIEDLFIVNYLVKTGGGPSFLDEKVDPGLHEPRGARRRGFRDGRPHDLLHRLTASPACASMGPR